MRFLRRFFIRLSNFTTGRRADQRLREEMAEHVALQTEENLRAGMSPVEARAYRRLADDFQLKQEEIAAAVGKDSLLRTRVRAEAPSKSSASCSPSCSGLVAPASRAVSVSRAAKAFL